MRSVIRSDGTILSFPQESKSKSRQPNVVDLVLPCRDSSRGSDGALLRAANRGYRSLTQPL
jgi:hypothetical protein